jgi:hypothetical protein
MTFGRGRDGISDPLVERQLATMQRRFKWRRFWQGTALVGSSVSALVLLIGVLIDQRVLRDELGVALSVLLLLLLAAAGFVLVVILSAIASRPRPEIAAALERVWEPLLDRLNALVSLETRKSQPEIRPYFERIERQAQLAIPLGGLPSPDSPRTTLVLWLAWAVMASGTIWFYAHYEPWSRIGEEPAARVTARPAEEGAPLPPPPQSAAELTAPWGEVRITEPGRDLKVTKVDVVPLQVEAASDRALQQAAWYTAANGAARIEHKLPPPPEPNFAVYKPLLYVDELGLQDWDLLTYYASAKTDRTAFASEVYFLEVRPFREDILKMPGGEGGKAYKGLNELTGLIDRQRQVLRETHRFLQQPPANPTLRGQDRGKLADAEGDLAVASRHLYAQLAAEMENQDVGDVLTHLAEAETLLGDAKKAIASEASDVLPKEQSALAELVATRKSFQKVVRDHPEAFKGEDGNENGDEEDEVPVAELPDKLKKIAEFRDEQKAVEEQVKKARDEQRRIADRAQREGAASFPSLAQEQEKLRQELEDVRAGHPQAFQGATKEADETQRKLGAAGEALRGGKPGAAEAGSQAAESLDALHKAMGRQRQGHDLAEAYKLKQAVEQSAKRLGDVHDQPQKFSDKEVQRTAEDARAATRELKRLAEDKESGAAFGPGLGRALGDRPQAELEERLESLRHAGSDAEKSQAAGEAQKRLERVAGAFDESLPSAVKDVKGADHLAPQDQEALARALQQLDSLAAQADAGRKPSDEDQQKQRRELLLNLQKGLHGRYGRNPRTAQLLIKIEEELGRKKPTPLEKSVLKKLKDEIEQFRAETSDARSEAPDASVLKHVDPSRLPAAYRERIQAYYRKLSEQQ